MTEQDSDVCSIIHVVIDLRH